MPKLTRIQSGDIINFILGAKSAKTLTALEQVVNEAKEIEDIEHNCTMIAEALASYKIMRQHIYRNKWKEGLQGGAIAGFLIAGISPAISPVVSLSSAAFRMFSGVVAGGTSALIYKEVNHYCNKERRREAQVGVMLDEANNRKTALENAPKLVK